MDINQQIKILETLLKLPDNRECSDCNSKTPRWASITFGTFVCLRCSGQHRQLQVHITKIKSVNLDKWAPEMVEMYKHINNTIINSYWEARLPKDYHKPGQNANSKEVESFIRDKYINKRWVDTSMSADPAFMYWNDRKKFDKYIKKLTTEASGIGPDEEEDSDDDKKKKKKSKKSKKSKKDHSDQSEEEVIPGDKIKTFKPPTSIAATIKSQKPAAPLDDLINLNAPISSVKQPSTGIDMGFTDFQDADPMKSTDDFQDFQQAGATNHGSSSSGNSNLNMQNLMDLYNQNPQFNMLQQPGALQNQINQANKYSALDVFSTQYQQQQQFQQQQQQQPGNPMFNPFAGMQVGVNQQRPQQTNAPQGNPGFMMGMMPPNAAQQNPSQQTNMFAGMNMTINVNQYGQMPQQQLNGAFGQFGGMPGNQMGSMMGGVGSQINQNNFKQQPPMNNFMNNQQQQMPKMQQPPMGQTQNNNYGGLVNLNNLGSNNANTPFGQSQGGFGAQGFQMGNQSQQQQQKKDAFSGLMSGLL